MTTDPIADLSSPDEQELANRILERLLVGAKQDLRAIAALMASKEDSELFGKTEFELRDIVHRVAAVAVEATLEEKKKRDT